MEPQSRSQTPLSILQPLVNVFNISFLAQIRGQIEAFF